MARVTSNFGSFSSAIFQANYAVCVCSWFKNVCTIFAVLVLFSKILHQAFCVAIVLSYILYFLNQIS